MACEECETYLHTAPPGDRFRQFAVDSLPACSHQCRILERLRHIFWGVPGCVLAGGQNFRTDFADAVCGAAAAVLTLFTFAHTPVRRLPEYPFE